MNGETHCPFCRSDIVEPFWVDRRRCYLRCRRCALVYVPPEYYLSPERERREYELHENAVDDPGYRRFLGRLFDVMLPKLGSSSHGLDFGCGPGPALAAMFREAGHHMALYDHFFAPDETVWSTSYDFICATEVVEHLHAPGVELDRLWSQLKPGGLLGVMTKLVIDRDAFSRWHYKNDLTHVCFFSRQTWRWWAKRLGAELRFAGSDVILFAKPHGNGEADALPTL